MNDSSLKMGILSTAAINELIIQGASRAASTDIAAVASRDRHRAEKYAENHGIAASYGDYESLINDPALDAIYISLPNSMHVEWTMRSLRAGKHVLCEKPLTRAFEDARRMFELAHELDLVLMEAFMWRHSPQTRAMLQLIEEGAVGAVRLMRAAFSYTTTDPADIRLDAALEGGALMDVGCYCVHAMRLLAGEPERLFAEQVLGETGVDMRLAGTLRFQGDVLGQFDTGFDLPVRDELEIIGAEGSLFIDDPWHARKPIIALRRKDRTESRQCEVADSYQLQLEDFERAVRKRQKPLLGRDDALGQALAIESLYRSAATGEAITLR
jgi:predicted dehydrogenase